MRKTGKSVVSDIIFLLLPISLFQSPKKLLNYIEEVFPTQGMHLMLYFHQICPNRLQAKDHYQWSLIYWKKKHLTSGQMLNTILDADICKFD